MKKSNKQRRAEIRARRLERAARIEAVLGLPDPRRAPPLRAPGLEPADVGVLARHNNTYGALPTYYVDRAFTCRDCGAEEVWTARQQKWWYEVVHGPIDSHAVRCLACRRARRAGLADSRQGEGANRLGEEVAWLRAVGDATPDAETERRVEAALASKWEGVRKVAIDVLGRWRRPQDAARLREWAMDERREWFNSVRRAASEALAPLLRHPQDDAWVLEAFAAARYVSWPWGAFVQGVPAATLDDFLARELDAGDPSRLANLCVMLMHARRLPSAAVWRRLLAHPDEGVARLVRHAAQMLEAAGASQNKNA